MNVPTVYRVVIGVIIIIIANHVTGIIIAIQATHALHAAMVADIA